MVRDRGRRLAVLLALLAIATMPWWASRDLERRRVQEALGRLIDQVETESLEEAATTVVPGDAVYIELEVHVVVLDLSDATEALLGETGTPRSFYSRKEAAALLRALQEAEGVRIESRRELVTAHDQRVVVACGDGVPFSTRFDFHVRLRKKDVQLDVTIERVAAVPDSPSKGRGWRHTSQGKVGAILQPGQPLIFGSSLKWESKARRVVMVPGLSRLPEVGSWFSFTSERDVREAYVAFVTARLVKLR